MEQHIKNDTIREKLGNCRTLHQTMELKRSKWLEKLANYDYSRNPRKLLKAWHYNMPRPVGRTQQTIKKSLSHTLTKSLGLSDKLNDWIKITKDKILWNETINRNLNLINS